MKVNLVSDSELTNEACQRDTGKPIDEWIALIDADPELASSRRDAIQWIYRQCKHIWWATTIWVLRDSRKGAVKKDGLAEGYHICSTKTVAVPAAKAFAALSPDALAPWFGPVETTGPSTYADADGNRFEVVRVRADKDHRWKWWTAGCDHATEIDVTFAEKAGKTLITLNHARIQDRPEADGVRNAWGIALATLKTQLESA